jgi:hypothetical protein
MTTGQYINIKDNKGIIHKWLIEEETENTYKIFCNGFVSEINKKNTYIKDDQLCASDIKDAHRTFDNKRYAKAEFSEIWLEQ